MEREFEGKKLLILGANPETIPLVEIANSMGVRTIVTSNRPEDAAKKYATKILKVQDKTALFISPDKLEEI